MSEPKIHLKEVYRSPYEDFDRTEYLRLDKNEDISGLPSEFVVDVLAEVTPEMLSTYPQLSILYQKLSNYLGVPENQILVTAGSDAAIKNIFEVFVEPGDTIVMPDPTYAMYYVYCQLFQANPKKIQYDQELKLSIDTYIEAIPNASLVALANPNSPTGTVVERSDLIRILNTAEKEDAIVLIDEAYYPFYSETAVDFINEYHNLVVTRTFSKAFSIASLRIGYAISNSRIISDLNKFRPIYETNAFGILFGCALLDNQQLVENRVKEVIEGRYYIERQMKMLGFQTYPSEANFIHINVGEDHATSLTKYLKEQGILVKSGFTHPTLKNCVRISLGPKYLMKRFIEEFTNYFGQQS